MSSTCLDSHHFSSGHHNKHVDMSSDEVSNSMKAAARADWSHSDHIKRESRHIYNKLHSILLDSCFVRDVHSRYPSLLLTANLRCGAWYTPPSITSAVSYFKSTDGHTHQWSFSLKRPNLHLLPDILQAGGAVIVDSTRRGKSMPDALTKTIPIWCTVLNAASKQKYGVPSDDVEGFRLEPPGWMIPPTEHDQIQSRIQGFVKALLDSDLEVPRLEKPLAPIFVTPQIRNDSLSEELPSESTPIVLVSASRFVSDSSNLDAPDRGTAQNRGRNFVYVQGAGDDHENWARGLTPDVFWKHQNELLACEKDRLEELVDKLVAEEGPIAASGRHWFTPLACPTWTSENGAVNDTAVDVEIGDTGVCIGTRTADHKFSDEERQNYSLIVLFTSRPTPAMTEDVHDSLANLSLSSSNPLAQVYPIQLSANKKGLLSIRTAFPPALELAHRILTSCAHPRDRSVKILVCCQDGKELSGSLAVAILSSSFSDSRQLITSRTEHAQHLESIIKDTTKRRLQWLVSCNPRCAPSRAFLLRVNEVLISPRHRPTA